MNKLRDPILECCHRLGIGERFLISRAEVDAAFAVPENSPYADTPREELLNSLESSAWGMYRLEPDGADNYLISRHPKGVRRVYADKAQRHLWKQHPDGYLVPAR